MTEPPQEPRQRAQRLANHATWVFIGSIGLALLTLAAVHAPARVKLLGLYSTAFGLLAGLALGWLARSLRVPRTRVSTAFALVLIGADLVGITVESHRLWANAEWEAFEKSPTGRMALKSVRNEQVPDDFKASLQETIDRQRDDLTFRRFLARRVAAVGTWREPWPFAFWLTEVIFASALGCWAFRRQTRPESAQ